MFALCRLHRNPLAEVIKRTMTVIGTYQRKPRARTAVRKHRIHLPSKLPMAKAAEIAEAPSDC